MGEYNTLVGFCQKLYLLVAILATLSAIDRLLLFPHARIARAELSGLAYVF